MPSILMLNLIFIWFSEAMGNMFPTHFYCVLGQSFRFKHVDSLPGFYLNLSGQSSALVHKHKPAVREIWEQENI